MRLLRNRPTRAFPVADGTRDGEPYRLMHPRLAAIDLLREHLAPDAHGVRRAGLDPYDPAVFLIDAHEHERVWVRRCLDLTGQLLGVGFQREDGRTRYRALLEADVRTELRLDQPGAPLMDDEPLASRAVDWTATTTSLGERTREQQATLRLVSETVPCRGCGAQIAIDPDADYCATCIAMNEGEELTPAQQELATSARLEIEAAGRIAEAMDGIVNGDSPAMQALARAKEAYDRRYPNDPKEVA